MINRVKGFIFLLAVIVMLTGCTTEVDQLQDQIDRFIEIGENYVDGQDFDGSHSFEKEIESGITEIRIDNNVGKINILGSNKENGEMKITKRVNTRLGNKSDIERGLDSIDVTISEKGDILTIKAVISKDLNNIFSSRAVDIDLSLPADIKLIRIENNVGDVTLNDMDVEEITIKTNVGDTFLINTTVESVDIAGNVGKMNFYNSLIKGKIKTSTGSITIEKGMLSGSSRVETSTGSISMTGGLNELGDYYFSSKTGSILMAINEDFSFNIDAKAGVGSIDNNIALDNMRMEKGRLRGSRNDGKANINITTDVGSIRLIKINE
ncbi:DUF4097 family beta strand repeat-containing protein [Alkaliphilus peptidifermentans]|uniref:Putative adhesin n=1 Tax=Alkaliphilus peptidifermentans DSM 18978 TaxID=1120976 RepID=A0A1G5KBE1_9FIRM|nr:DUF4097 family beta strand repeat-containing protein [Alkaliphilus peptidifermentans]SCY97368.1 Putative adhesin [Alkaliphilus peptidifermentans DSM 18978]